MVNKTRFHIGLRIIKTSVSSALAMLITEALHLEFPSLAVVAAVVILQPTFHETLDMSRRRILGTIIGSALGLIFVYFSPLNSTIEVFLGVLIILTLSNAFSLTNSSLLGVIAFVSLVTMPGTTYISAINRILNTVIGAGTSIAMNLLFPIQPIEKKSDEVAIKILMLDIMLLGENLKSVIGTCKLEQSDFTQINNDIIKTFNEAYNVRTLLQREQKYAIGPESFVKFNEKYNVLWSIHNSILQIHNDKEMFLPSEFAISDELRGQIADITTICDDILANGCGIPKEIHKRFDECCNKMEKLLKQDFYAVNYTTVYNEGSFFTILLTSLKRFSESLKVFELPQKN